jgi:hypothetical protein
MKYVQGASVAAIWFVRSPLMPRRHVLDMHSAFSQIDWSISWECYFGRW